MTRLFSLLFLLFTLVSFAQEEEEVHSIFFEFDKYNLKEEQANAVVAFVSKIDTTRIESIQIFGYCDDRGRDAYNYTLSTNRANTVKNKLIERGIKSKIIITLEGKGRIMLDEVMQTNVPEGEMLDFYDGKLWDGINHASAQCVFEHLANRNDVLTNRDGAVAFAHEIHEVHQAFVGDGRDGRLSPARQQVSIQPVSQDHQTSS